MITFNEFKRHFSNFYYFLIFLFWSGCGGNNRDYDSLINHAIADKYNENFHAALDEVNAAIKLDSTKYLGFLLRGRILSAMDSSVEALHDYQKVLEFDSTNVDALFYQGISFSIIDSEDSAIASYDKALQTKMVDSIYFEVKVKSPLDLSRGDVVTIAKIRYFKGISLCNVERYSEAAVEFQASLDDNYQTAQCNRYLGIIYLSQGRHSQGCIYLDEAIKEGDKEALEYSKKYCGHGNK